MQINPVPPLPGVCFSEIVCELCGNGKKCRLMETPADFISLTCSHGLCVKCFKKYLGDSLDKGVFDILCPSRKGCRKSINYFTIENDFPEGIKLLEQKIIDINKKPEKKEKPIDSANNNNNNDNKMEIEGPQIENRKEIDSEDFINQNYKKCPNCNAPIEKTRGCYTMRCFSPTCQGKTFFCYLCGEKLTPQTEKEHYGGNSFQKCKVLLEKK